MSEIMMNTPGTNRRFSRASRALKDEYELLQEYRKLADEFNLNREQRQALISKIRERINRLQARNVDPLAKSLMEEERHVYRDEMGETVYQIGYLCENDMTDEEIRELIHDYIELPPINSPYDCTGKRFTHWVGWHRNPCGLVSFVHSIGLDV